MSTTTANNEHKTSSDFVEHCDSRNLTANLELTPDTPIPDKRATSSRYIVSVVARYENFTRWYFNRRTRDWNYPISIFLEPFDGGLEFDYRKLAALLDAIINKFDELRGLVGLSNIDLSRHDLDLVAHHRDMSNLEEEPEDCLEVGTGWHYPTSATLTEAHEKKMAFITEIVSLIVEGNSKEYHVTRRRDAYPLGRVLLYYFNLPPYMKQGRKYEDGFKVHLNAILEQFSIDLARAIPNATVSKETLLMDKSNHASLPGPIIAVKVNLDEEDPPSTVPDFGVIRLDSTKAAKAKSRSKVIKFHFAGGDRICVKCKSTSHIRDNCGEEGTVAPQIFRTKVKQSKRGSINNRPVGTDSTATTPQRFSHKNAVRVVWRPQGKSDTPSDMPNIKKGDGIEIDMEAGRQALKQLQLSSALVFGRRQEDRLSP
ncbi:hypothetical protein CJU90_3128 [Yarrowia sp. C11]|nr:hypothetical protein CKK34_4577 [Yarrowia sp. E02]KAG5369650.1 hypothetical protein CJU90_3128 [Yarrowia sp. C11]